MREFGNVHYAKRFALNEGNRCGEGGENVFLVRYLNSMSRSARG